MKSFSYEMVKNDAGAWEVRQKRTVRNRVYERVICVAANKAVANELLVMCKRRHAPFRPTRSE